MLKVEMLATLSGKVQGVGFRTATRSLAEHLQLDGYVRNLPNGSVEILAQGSKEELETLISFLKETFSITHVQVHFSQITKCYTGFSIQL